VLALVPRTSWSGAQTPSAHESLTTNPIIQNHPRFASANTITMTPIDYDGASSSHDTPEVHQQVSMHNQIRDCPSIQEDNGDNVERASSSALAARSLEEGQITKASNLLQSSPEEKAETTEESPPPRYELPVDAGAGDRAVKLNVLSLRRPHMRAFYAAMLSFFVGAFLWFAVAPLQTAIQAEIGLSDQELFTASIASIAGNFITRILVGTMCDLYGARRLDAVLLLLSSVACGLTALVRTSAGLTVARFFTGMAGGTLVVSQFWMSCMFTKNIIGLATGLVLGIGNSGGGFALLFLGSLVLPQLEGHITTTPSAAWRLTLIVPTVVGLIAAMIVWSFSDDTPLGRYLRASKRCTQAARTSDSLSMTNTVITNTQDDDKFRRFRTVLLDSNTWILFLQYGVSSGGNVAMNNAAPLYFEQAMGLTNASASAVGSAVGWLSLACFVGGLVSDKLMARSGIVGRKWCHFLFLLTGGGLILAFAHARETGPSILAFALFSLFLTLTTGTTFALVPYVNPEATGSVAGIAASGGGVGAISFLLLLQQLSYYWSFVVIGSIVIVVACLSHFLRLREQPNLATRRSSILESVAF